MTEIFNDSFIGTLKMWGFVGKTKWLLLWFEKNGFTKNNYSQWNCKNVIVLIFNSMEWIKASTNISSLKFKAEATDVLGKQQTIKITTEKKKKLKKKNPTVHQDQSNSIIGKMYHFMLMYLFQ